MAIPVLLMGKSGSGKSASLRNVGEGWLVINVTRKPLPFKAVNDFKVFNCNDYLKIRDVLGKCKDNGITSIVIDDAGYLLTDKFMVGHRQAKGNSLFELYNEIGDNFYSLIRYINDELPSDVVVYIVMHEDKNDFGEVKPKTIGRMLDEKVVVEGLFSIVLRSLKLDGKYVISTHTDGLDVVKTPIGMFDVDYIENDLLKVDNVIKEYYKEG